MGFIEEFSLQFRPFLDIKNLKTFRVCHVQTLSYLLPSGSFSLTFEFLFLTLIERRRKKKTIVFLFWLVYNNNKYFGFFQFTFFRYMEGKKKRKKKISIHVATIHSLSNQKSRPFSSSLCAKFKHFLSLPPHLPRYYVPPFFKCWKKKNSFLKNMKCYGNREIQSDGISSFKRARKPLSLLLKIPFFSFCAYVFFVFRRVFIGRWIIGQSASQFAISFLKKKFFFSIRNFCGLINSTMMEIVMGF